MEDTQSSSHLAQHDIPFVYIALLARLACREDVDARGE